MQTKKNGQVNFFTNEINVSFVQNEILNLSNCFSKVNVFAFKNDNSIVFPNNVIVKEVNHEGYSTAKAFSGSFLQFVPH
ncbi:MAG: hypothetical protein IPG89_18480 [Bacteroidetes bacterium]|nr:hypothetical protein [Bacteroidota bacterium]